MCLEAPRTLGYVTTGAANAIHWPLPRLGVEVVVAVAMVAVAVEVVVGAVVVELA